MKAKNRKTKHPAVCIFLFAITMMSCSLASSPTIVGKWQMSATGVTTAFQFNADKTFTESVSGSGISLSVQGNYSDSGSTITATVTSASGSGLITVPTPNQQLKWDYVLAPGGTTLILTDQGTSAVLTLTRV